ncbi:putative DNA-binding domain-containing protein [Vibrio nomapromontoriensis]|uniref:HvfC/BufC family peptide modification chaperone n=1 Tax=Vibrio nomapromontoriensis TaxID=2910246 RepID=UPI003D14B57E
MCNPPGLMLRQTEALAKCIRSPQAMHSHCQYGGFIRNNIHSVVRNTFPYFAEQVGQHKLYRLIDDFLLRHSALEPEFHHIATEFVQYAQQSQQLDTLSTSVLEYEWAVFSVEIDQAFTPQGVIWNDSIHAQPHAYTLSGNPTLQLLKLPFEISQHAVPLLENNVDSQYYGVFRTVQHRVVSQKLRAIDVALIQIIQPVSQLNLLDFQQHTTAQLTSFDALQWTQHFTTLELVQLQASGD